MDGLNPRIFDSVLKQWNMTIGRPLFPDNYEDLKLSIQKEYMQLYRDPVSARVIAEVLHSSSNKGKTEISLEAKETKAGGKAEEAKETKGDPTCWICDRAGHMMKDCWYYDPSMTKEANREIAAKEIEKKKKSRAEVKTAKKADDKEAKKADNKAEKVNKCAEIVPCGCDVRRQQFEISDAEVIMKSAGLKTELCNERQSN